MKYKIGDKVRIKTWQQMEKEFGLTNSKDAILCNCTFTIEMENFLTNENKTRVVIIKKIINNEWYKIMEDQEYGCWNWTDEMIEGLAKEEIVPIFSRWELLDL